MLVISEFLLQEVKPLVARLIYEPNDTKTMSVIVEKLTAFGAQIPQLFSDGKLNTEHFQQYNGWLTDFLRLMGTNDYINALDTLHPKTLLK